MATGMGRRLVFGLGTHKIQNVIDGIGAILVVFVHLALRRFFAQIGKGHADGVEGFRQSLLSLGYDAVWHGLEGVRHTLYAHRNVPTACDTEAIGVRLRGIDDIALLFQAFFELAEALVWCLSPVLRQYRRCQRNQI